jgi:alkylation response protein AidB-like acyl-CoA dehydrogenase
MDWRFSEEQSILKKVAHDFLLARGFTDLAREMEGDEKGYSPQIWQEIAEMGWMGIVFPEEFGGSGMSFLDLAVLLEEMGRACFPGPFFSTVILGGLPILDAGTKEQKEEYLPGIANGKLIFTLALTEASGGYDAGSIEVDATDDGDAYIINGKKLFVPDANVADTMICAARTSETPVSEQGITLFIVEAKSPGIGVTGLKTISKNKLCEVVFDQVRVPKRNALGGLNQGWNTVQKIIQWVSVAKCCEMVGGMQRVMDLTVEYAKIRAQFGALIGTFQAVQHHCANMLVDMDCSKAITYEAAWRLSKGLPCTKEASMAKAWVSEAYKRVVTLGTQVHGGTAIIDEHDMTLYFRRAKSAELAFGDARFHRQTVAQNLGFRIP